jgi:hypothetical protein
MADVFLSYARPDRDCAKQIAEALEARGWSVWWDADLVAGVRFRDEISEQLHAAKCVVVLWSNASLKSDFVIDEADDGKRRGVLVQAVIEDVRPPSGFRQIQHARLIDWDGRDSNEFERLCAGIERHSPRSASPRHSSSPHADRWVAHASTVRGCTYAIAPTVVPLSADGGKASVRVSAAAECPWTATSSSSWITITSGASGSGDGSITLAVDANADATGRFGTVTIAGLTLTVMQTGGDFGKRLLYEPA